MDPETIIRERAPHLQAQFEGALESIRKCAVNAKAIAADSDLTPQAKSREIRKQLRVGLDGSRETFATERARAARTTAALVEKRNNLRLPEPLTSRDEAIIRALSNMQLNAELRALPLQERSRLLRESASAGDRKILDAVNASVDGLGLDREHQVEPAWRQWTEVVSNGDWTEKIEQAEAVERAIDAASRMVYTQARNLVNEATADPHRPNANDIIKQEYESALKEMQSDAAHAAARERFEERTGVKPKDSGAKPDDAEAETAEDE